MFLFLADLLLIGFIIYVWDKVDKRIDKLEDKIDGIRSNDDERSSKVS